MKLIALPFLIASGLANPAHADEASFVQASSQICLADRPDLNNAETTFQANGWQVFQGAGPGEFEAYKDSSIVFVITAKAGIQSGCTVMDENVTLTQATAILNAELETIPPASWAVVSDDYGLHWEIYLDDSLIALTVQDGMGGGGAISFEERPDE